MSKPNFLTNAAINPQPIRKTHVSKSRTCVLGIACVVAGMFVSGCTSTVKMHYSAPTVQPIQNASNVSVNVHVADQRTNTKKVGDRPILGGGLLDILLYYCGVKVMYVTDPDTATIVRKAIENELAERGFLLSDDQQSASRVNVDVTRFYIEMLGGAGANLDLKVTVKDKGDNSCYERRFTGQGPNKKIMQTWGSWIDASLNQALSNGINQIFTGEDFIEALLESGGMSVEAP